MANAEQLKPHVDMLTLASCVVKNEYEQDVKIASLWQKAPAILIFLRHFACIACRAHAKQVWQNRAAYEKDGAKIHFIGNGQARYIAAFKEDLGLAEASVFTDPQLSCFRAAGFRRGFLAALGPRAVANGLKLLKDGHKQTAYGSGSGDLWQLGGILVIRPEGRVAYHYISEVLGDFPPEKDVTT